MPIKELQEALLNGKSLEEILTIKKQWNSKYIIPLQNQLLNSSPQDKKTIGIKLSSLKKEGDQIFNNFKEKLKESSKKPEILDLSVFNYHLSRSSFNPLEEIKEDLISFFNQLNFQIASGKEIVSVEENFDNLFIPKDHPSRSESETFYIDDKNLLRPHCTVSSVNYLLNTKNKTKDLRLAIIGSVYRRDDESSKHTHQFSQLDFLWLDKNLTLANLKWFLKLLLDRIFGFSVEYRFRNSFFPFTQPSFEVDMKCSCGGFCNLCKGSGWIEIMGAGMLRREIINNAGYAEEYESLAGGLGLERIALIKYGISDIRELYLNNFEFLKNDY